MTRKRSRLLIVMPRLNPPGGGEGVAVWALEALKHDNRLTVLTLVPSDLCAINQHYGSRLQPGDFEEIVAYPQLIGSLDRLPTPLTHLKYSLLLRHCKTIFHRFDLVLGFYNEADFGRSGLQFVHYPMGESRSEGDRMRWIHPGSGTGGKLYCQLCGWLSDFDIDRMKLNRTLANSVWTGRQITAAHGLGSTTLYPPVFGQFPRTDWDAKSNGFCCIGRFHPHKRMDAAIRIIESVRLRGFPVRLDLFGAVDDGVYYRQIQAMVNDRRSWCRLHVDLERSELLHRAANVRYGLHTMNTEPFGMAVAEMMWCGCIPFVPNHAGPGEILEHNAELCFDSDQDAVDKICRLLKLPVRQKDLLGYLATRREAFTTRRFSEQLRQIVSDALFSIEN